MRVRDHNGIRYEILKRWRPIHNHYRLLRDYTTHTRIKGTVISGGGFLELCDGDLLIRAGFPCDGPSGPTVDTKSFMRAAFGHDAKYSLMREGLIPQSSRIIADREMRIDNEKDGMGAIRCFYTYWAVRLFAGYAARQKP